MARSLDDLIAHGDELAEIYSSVEPSALREPSTRSKLAHAAMRRAAAERDLRKVVVSARGEGISWAEIGKILGVSGEAARKRYGKAVGEEAPTEAEAAQLKDRSLARDALGKVIEGKLGGLRPTTQIPVSPIDKIVKLDLGSDARAALVALLRDEAAETVRRVARDLDVDVPDDASSLL